MDQLPLPLTAAEVLELYFLENRARLLEIASFLDRIDRAAEPETVRQDFRYRALMRGLQRLAGTGCRAEAVQLILSDPSCEPLASAAGLRAVGAWDSHEDH